MSIIQTSIIGSAVEVYIPPPPPQYPAPGSNYPANTGHSFQPSNGGVITGFYEAGSVVEPVIGLWRRAYNGYAINQDGSLTATFPASFTVQESLIDQAVGFGAALDGASEYSMEWLGYFKPAQSGPFTFSAAIDDAMYLWIGENAVTGFTSNNYVLLNSTAGSDALILTADKYYPVRMRYTEYFGGNQCSISYALTGQPFLNNLQNAAIGQFYTDANTTAGTFPASGLIT